MKPQSASEIETTIVWTADDDRAVVYSLMPRIWKQCIAAGGEEIHLDHGIRDGKKVVRTFLVPVNLIAIRRLPQLSAEETERRRERGKALALRRHSPNPGQLQAPNDKEGHS